MNDNQTQLIRMHLLEGKSITNKKAFELFGCTRLSARIYDLRHKYGMNIVTIDRVGKTRYGDTCIYAEYRLKKEN